MALSKKIIKRRIASVRNTRKITKAMELVAAAKMRRAVSAVTKSRPYTRASEEIVKRIIASGERADLHPLLKAPEEGRTLIIVYASDRGLAGGYNVNLIRHVLKRIEEEGRTNVDAVILGKHAIGPLSRAGVPLLAHFPALTNHPSFNDTLPITKLVRDAFLSGTHKKVLLAYTNFVSGIKQEPVGEQLLPLKVPESHGSEPASDILFEPTPHDILAGTLPVLVETLSYHALLEAAASEHAARMMAMRSATDAATDMLDDLSFTYSQVRQASITQEIAELVSGSAAISS